MSSSKETAIQFAKDYLKKLNNKDIRAALLEKALAEIGTTEFPSGSNNVKYNTWFYGREVHDGDKPGAKYPWCCTFICWLFPQIGKKMPVADYLRGWSSVPNLYKYAVKHDMITTTPQPGDLVIYFWGGEIKHIGMYLGENAGDAYRIDALEGNTSFGDDGSQDNGGCCTIKHQSKKLVHAYVNIDKFIA